MNSNQNTKFFIHENVVCEMAAICPGGEMSLKYHSVSYSIQNTRYSNLWAQTTCAIIVHFPHRWPLASQLMWILTTEGLCRTLRWTKCTNAIQYSPNYIIGYLIVCRLTHLHLVKMAAILADNIFKSSNFYQNFTEVSSLVFNWQ